MADASLIFNTKIDTEGVQKGTKDIDRDFSESAKKIKTILSDTERTARSKAAAIAAEYRKMGKTQSEAFKAAWVDIKQSGNEASEEVIKSAEAASRAVSETTATTSDSFTKISDTTEHTNDTIVDSFKNYGKNIMESRDWITMAVKAIVGVLKAEADAAMDILSMSSNVALQSAKTVVSGIGKITAATGKLTLKQFIGDWEKNGGIKKLLITAGSLFSAYKLIDFGKSGIQLGSDLSEVQNVVDVTFSHMSDKVDEWAKKAQDAYGLSETMAKKYVGLYGSMSEAFGFSEEQAFEMSSTLAGLAGDVASFYNIDQDLAYTKLKSVFSGETETLKDLGIVMTENALNDFAMRKGMGKTVSKMSEAEKVSLRYRFVLEQLNNAAGDFTRTQDSWANQTRILNLQWQTLQATIGRGLINAFTPALRVINRLIEGLQKIAQRFENLTIAVFGDSASSSGAMTEGLETAADSADNFAGSVGNALKKAEELRYGLAGFDELNVLADTGENALTVDDTAENVVKSATVIDNAIETAEKKADSFSQVIQQAIKNGKWQKVGLMLADKLAASLDGIPWNSIREKAVSAAQHIGDFINGALQSPDLWINIGHSIAQGLNTAMDFLLSLLRTVNFYKAGFDLAEMLNEFLTTFDADEYGALVAEKVNAVFDFLAGFAFDFDWSQLGTKIGDALSSYFEKLDLTKAGKSGKTIPETVAGMINGLIRAGIRLFTYEFTDENGETHNLWEYIGAVLGEGFNAFLENFNLTDAVNLLKTGIKSFVGMIYNAFRAIAGEDGNGFKKLGAELAGEVNNWLGDTEWWTDIGEMLGTIINDILDFALSFLDNLDDKKLENALMTLLDSVNITNIASKLFQIFKEAILKPLAKAYLISLGLIFQPLNMILLIEWEKLVKGAGGVWEAIQKVFSHVGDWFKNVFSDAWQKVKDVFSSGGRIFEGIKEGISNVFGSVVNHLIDGINAVIGDAFSGINVMLSNVRDFEVFGNHPFAFIQTIDVPQIPRLATGTVVPAHYGEFLAVLGDNKREPEVVSPVSAMKQAFLEALAEGGYGGSDRPVYCNVVLEDGTVLFRAMGEADDSFYRSHGFSRFDRRRTT